MTKDEPIDFVITWVDGADEAWRAEKEKYMSRITRDEKERNTEARYRDLGLLRYWFRGVEKFAPWVRKVHFVTCGQKPDWLDPSHPKLHLVNHSDYMPPEDLPTFNSNAIELGMHCIPGLSERFVYFNDDFFLTAPVTPGFFFKNGLPRDMYEIKLVTSYGAADAITYIGLNDIGVINKHFWGRKSKLCHASKKYSPIYPFSANVRNLLNLIWNPYLGMAIPHLALPYRKKDFEAVWAVEEDRLKRVCANKFRTPFDISHSLIRYWRLVNGEFAPTNVRRYGKYFGLRELSQEPISAIRNQTYKMLCLNDDMDAGQFEAWKEALRGAFEAILPEKSSYEL